MNSTKKREINAGIQIIDIGIKNFKNLTRWYLAIADREAVKKGYDFMNRGEVIPKP